MALMRKRKKFFRLPSLTRCNQKGNFPFGFTKFHSQIYANGLPHGYVELDYKLGKDYKRLYMAIRLGYLRGIIFKNEKGKWQYAVKARDLKKKEKKTTVAFRATRSLARIKDLDGMLWVSLSKAAFLVGFDYDTLKAAFDHENLLAEIPTEEDYETLKLDKRTKYIVQVQELRIWLDLVARGEIISRAKRQKRSKKVSKLRTTAIQRKSYDKKIVAVGKHNPYAK